MIEFECNVHGEESRLVFVPQLEDQKAGEPRFNGFKVKTYWLDHKNTNEFQEQWDQMFVFLSVENVKSLKDFLGEWLEEN